MAMERQLAALARFKRSVAAGEPDLPCLWAANSCTRAEYDRAVREARLADVRRRAEIQRRMRQDAWADQYAAQGGR